MATTATTAMPKTGEEIARRDTPLMTAKAKARHIYQRFFTFVHNDDPQTRAA
ncbi:MAG: hypothetical protein ABSA57_06000 [Candidatus Acidiferrales bacterium]